MPARSTALALAAAITLLVPAGASADPPHPDVSTFAHTDNMVPLGSSPNPMPAAGVFNSDLAFWGDRAYQGTYWGFRIIDISNPEDPVEILDFDACHGSQGDVIVWNNLLVRSWNSAATVSTNPPGPVTCDGDIVPPGFEGLHIFDISNPQNPDLVGSVPLPCGSHTATGVPDTANNRLLVYNSASSATCPWIEIVSVPLNAPGTASLVALAGSGRSCHDTAVILGAANLAACAGGNGLTVWSIGGPRGGSLTAPVQLWTKTITGVSIGHAASFSWDGEIVIFGHEPGGGSQAQCQESSPPVNKTVFFFKASDGAQLGTWMMPRPQTPAENCTIHNFNTVPSATRNILVSGNYQSGISVVDFTDPAQATEIAYADPDRLPGMQLGGDWSSYWYNGHIYEGDITRGLLVWRLIDDPADPYDDGAVADAQMLQHANPQTQEFTIA
ncbi:MAG: LVIVD repeat-containing protein [Actinomycetota bacterium]